MSKESKGSGTGRVSGREMADALADVMKDQTDKAQIRSEVDSRGPKKKTSPFAMVFLLLSLAASAYIWFGNPDWVQTGPAALPPSLAEAGLRIEIFEQAIIIDEFLEVEGRLPDDLEEVGDLGAGVEYTQVDSRTYRLILPGDLGPMEYISTETAEDFLGNSLQVIRQGG